VTATPIADSMERAMRQKLLDEYETLLLAWHKALKERDIAQAEVRFLKVREQIRVKRFMVKP